MAAPTGSIIQSVCGALCGRGILGSLLRPTLVATQQCRFAARKGTREKARKKKIKVEEKKIGFIPHNQRESAKNKVVIKSRKIDDSWKAIATDNVWTSRYYRWRVYSFEEAVQCHRETHHPSIYNLPDSFLNVTIELDMKAEKKNRFVDKFSGTVAIPHGFDHGQPRSILAFVKNVDQQRAALEAGATTVGGMELIKEIQSGELVIQDYQHIVASIDMLTDLVPVRGLMKRRFPNAQSGSLSDDVGKMVKTFKEGIQFAALFEERERDYGWIDSTIGTLNMETAHLKANLIALLKDVNKRCPLRKAEPFVWRVVLSSPPSVEKLKVDHIPLLVGHQSGSDLSSDSDSEGEEEEEKEVAAASVQQ